MAFSNTEGRGEKIWTYVCTAEVLVISANMGIKRLSYKGKAGVATVQGDGSVNNGVSAYTSAAQDIAVGDVNTFQASEGFFLDGITFTAAAGVVVYIEAVV